MTRYLAYHCTGQFPLADIYLGDDSVCVIQDIVNLEDWANFAKEKFGMDLNVENYVTTNPQNVHFLGYNNMQGLPLKGQDFPIASFLYPERPTDSPIVTAARALGQLWSTMNPYAASTWHDVVTYILHSREVTIEQVTEHLSNNPEAFRYLRMMGLNVAQLGLPPKTVGLALDMQPRSVPRKRYQKQGFDLEELMKAAAERTALPDDREDPIYLD